MAGHGRDIDDRATTGSDHARAKNLTRHQSAANQVEVEIADPIIDGDVFDRIIWRHRHGWRIATGRVDEDRHLAPGISNFIGGSADRIAIRGVNGDKHRFTARSRDRIHARHAAFGIDDRR